MLRLGIVGYGNLGSAIERAIAKRSDLALEAVFTRRQNAVTAECAHIFGYDAIEGFAGRIDCLLIAGGSRGDLPSLTPKLAAKFNTVDTFDNHLRIKEHFETVDRAARAGERVTVISAGWDPGFLSVIRYLAAAFMPDAAVNTFWGDGVSQGHSEALRRISGVKDAVQLTLPIENGIRLAAEGISLSTRDTHRRKCYVAAERGEEERIEREVRGIPGYFEGYDTEIIFTDEEEIRRLKSSLHHRGRVIAAAPDSSLDLSLSLNSNPDYTARIAIAAAVAANRLNALGFYGAKTVLDIPPRLFADLSPYDYL